MPKMSMVEMSKDGQENIRVMPSSAKVWERNGWTVVDDGDSKSEEKAAPAKADLKPVPGTPNQAPATEIKE